MKISFVIYGLGSGGAERAVSGLANHWVHENEISIITLVKCKPFYPLDPKIDLQYCLDNQVAKTNVLKSFRDVWNRLKKLNRLLDKNKPDVVISFMTKTNIYTIWVCKWLNIPCIISERANHDLNRLPRFQEWLRNLSYKYMSALVVQTFGNKKYYNRILKDSRIVVIPNAIANSFKNPRMDRVESKERIILNVGAFRKAKAQNILLKAFAKISSDDWKLLFLGQGPYLEKQKDLANKLGITDKVEFLGSQKDVASYYNRASLFVFTSEHEGFPNALLEALYFGLPSISTNCPHGPSDMITNEENGFLVPVGDVDALAQKMEQLMNSEAIQKKFRENALKSTQKYEMEPIANKWMEVIKTALAQ